MNEIRKLLQKICLELKEASSREQAIAESKEHYYHIDFNVAYGGYRIDKVNSKTGSHYSTAFGETCVKERISKKEMVQFLIGFLNGIKHNEHPF